MTFLRKNVLSLALWEKYLINAVLKIFSLAEWAGKSSGLIKETQRWEAGPPIQAQFEQTCFLSPKACKCCQDHLHQAHAKWFFFFSVSAVGRATSRVHKVGLPRKQAGSIQISLPFTAVLRANHFLFYFAYLWNGDNYAASQDSLGPKRENQAAPHADCLILGAQLQ